MDEEMEQLTTGPITRRRSGVFGTDRVLRARNEKNEASSPSSKKEMTPSREGTPRTLRKPLGTDTPTKRSARASSAQPSSPAVKRVSVRRRSSSLHPESPNEDKPIRRVTRSSVTPTSISTDAKSTPKHRYSLISSTKSDNSPEYSKIPVKDPVVEIKRMTRSASSPARESPARSVGSRKSSYLKDPISSPSSSSPESEVINKSAATRVTRSLFVKVVNLSPVQETKSESEIIASKNEGKDNIPNDKLDLTEDIQSVEIISSLNTESEVLPCPSTAAPSDQANNESCIDSEDSGIKEMEDFNFHENNVRSTAPENSSQLILEIYEDQNNDPNCRSVISSSEIVQSEDQIIDKYPVIVLARCTEANKKIESSIQKISVEENLCPGDNSEKPDLTESMVNPTLYQCSSSDDLEESRRAIHEDKNVSSKDNSCLSISCEEPESQEIKASLSAPLIQVTPATPKIVSSMMPINSNSFLNVKTEDLGLNKRNLKIILNACEGPNDVSDMTTLSETPDSRSLDNSSGISESESVVKVVNSGLDDKIGKVDSSFSSSINVEDSDSENCLKLHLDESYNEEHDKELVNEDSLNNTCEIKDSEKSNNTGEITEKKMSTASLNSSVASTGGELKVLDSSNVIKKSCEKDCAIKIPQLKHAMVPYPNTIEADKSLDTDEVDISMSSNKVSDNSLKDIDSFLIDSESEVNSPLKTGTDNSLVKPMESGDSNLLSRDSLINESVVNESCEERTYLINSPCRGVTSKESSLMVEEHKRIEEAQETNVVEGKVFNNITAADSDILKKSTGQKGTMPKDVNETILVSGALPKRENNLPTVDNNDMLVIEEKEIDLPVIEKGHALSIIDEEKETSMSKESEKYSIDILSNPEKEMVSDEDDVGFKVNETSSIETSLTKELENGYMRKDEILSIEDGPSSMIEGDEEPRTKAYNTLNVDKNESLFTQETETPVTIVNENTTVEINEDAFNNVQSYTSKDLNEVDALGIQNDDEFISKHKLFAEKTAVSLSNENKNTPNCKKNNELKSEVGEVSIIKEGETCNENRKEGKFEADVSLTSSSGENGTLYNKLNESDTVEEDIMLVSKDDTADINKVNNSCIKEVSSSLSKNTSCNINNDEICDFSSNSPTEACIANSNLATKINEGLSKSEPLVSLLENHSKIMNECTSYEVDDGVQVSTDSVETERVPSENSFHETFNESESLPQASDEDTYSQFENLPNSKLRSVVRIVTPTSITYDSVQNCDISKGVTSDLHEDSDDWDPDYIEEEEREEDSLEENSTNLSSDDSRTLNYLLDEVKEETESDSDFIPEVEQDDVSLEENFTDCTTDESLCAKDFLDDEAEEGDETSDSGEEVSDEDIPVIHIQSCSNSLYQSDVHKPNECEIAEYQKGRIISKKVNSPLKRVELRNKYTVTNSANVINEVQRNICFSRGSDKFKIRKSSDEYMYNLFNMRPHFSAGTSFTVENGASSLKHTKSSIFSCNTHWKVENDKTHISSNADNKAHCNSNHGKFIDDKSIQGVLHAKKSKFHKKTDVGNVNSDDVTKGKTSLANFGVKFESNSVKKHSQMKGCNTVDKKGEKQKMRVVGFSSGSNTVFNEHIPSIRQLPSTSISEDARKISHSQCIFKHPSLMKRSNNYVFIHNLSIGTNAFTIKNILKTQEITEMTKIDLSKCSPRSFLEGRGYAEIEFECPDDANKCLQRFSQGVYHKGKNLIATDSAQELYSYD